MNRNTTVKGTTPEIQIYKDPRVHLLANSWYETLF